MRFRRLADFLQRLFQGRHADPVHFGAEGQRRAYAVDVAVGQAGNHGAAAEINQLCLAAREFLHRGRGTRSNNPAVPDRQRLTN